jgi:hypothetical protein
VQTNDCAGAAFGHPEPVAQRRDGAALAIRGQKFPVMMVSGRRRRGCDPEISWPIVCLSEDLSGLRAGAHHTENSGFGAKGVT